MRACSLPFGSCREPSRAEPSRADVSHETHVGMTELDNQSTARNTAAVMRSRVDFSFEMKT